MNECAEPLGTSPPLPTARWSTRAVRTVARDTLLEAMRGRWLWMATGGALGVAGVATFVHGLALSEERDLALSFAAPLARLVAVMIVALSAISSTVREQIEGTLSLALAAPMRRSSWLIGKTLGFLVLAALTAIVLTLPLCEFAPAPTAVVAWFASLTMELALIASVSLAIGLAVTRIPLATGALVAFYVLARDLHLMQLLAARADNYSQLGVLAPAVQATAALFPRLDLFTRTTWLLGSPPGVEALALIAVQTWIYCLLALTVAALDLQRAQLR